MDILQMKKKKSLPEKSSNHQVIIIFIDILTSNFFHRHPIHIFPFNFLDKERHHQKKMYKEHNQYMKCEEYIANGELCGRGFAALVRPLHSAVTLCTFKRPLFYISVFLFRLSSVVPYSAFDTNGAAILRIQWSFNFERCISLAEMKKRRMYLEELWSAGEYE
ncbi:hypothetical protein FF38_11622 [Lucilia cuprina]|uniref:Uncharacterized protein n=1 Tax=Lucilia cuprina TaxID=7375 RepID=A0A0L0BVH7_LUCCU|nr:hypothetical protein FF38_11622 [Lucilia cuprina]